MTPKEIRAIALEVADPLRLRQYGTEGIVDFATRFLAAIDAKAEPDGWIDGDGDPYCEYGWGQKPPRGWTTCDEKAYPVYRHHAIEPALQQQRPAYGGTCANLHATVQVPDAVCAAPLPDEVAQMVENLRSRHRMLYQASPIPSVMTEAADMLERLARQVPEGCVVVPREPTEAMMEAWRNDTSVLWADTYKAMIAAA